MNPLHITVVLGLMVGAWAQVKVLQPECDSPEAEEAALVAQDYLNAQHAHGYKYALNRIEKVNVYVTPDGNRTYVLEIDLLETDCHVLDPTPVVNCTVRPKHLTAVEGDCDVVLKKVEGVLTVKAFKCKTEESTEDLCVGCPVLLPLNDTVALDFVHASLATFNNMTVNMTYSLLEVGRVSSQIGSGGPVYAAEYVVVEANCTDDACVPLNDGIAIRGICTAKGRSDDHLTDCKMFPTLMPAEANGTAAAALPTVHVHALSRKQGLRHHKLTTFHDPHVSGLLSAESAESAEVVPVAPAVANTAPTAEPADSGSKSDASVSTEVPVAVVKRDVPDAPASAVEPVILIPVCPGKIRFF